MSKGPSYRCNCGCGKSDYFPSYLFFGPERASYPGGNNPYTEDRIVFRGYVLRKWNTWERTAEKWSNLDTAVSVAGSGDVWEARVAGVTAEGATRLEALQEAWAGAEFEEQTGKLAPVEACRV